MAFEEFEQLKAFEAINSPTGLTAQAPERLSMVHASDSNPILKHEKGLPANCVSPGLP